MSDDEGRPKKTVRASEEFWDRYDKFWKERNYSNRSEAVRDDLAKAMTSDYKDHFREVRELCYDNDFEDALNYTREIYSEDEPERAWLEEYVELFRPD